LWLVVRSVDMVGADPLGRAMLDYQRGGLRGVCQYRDGDETADALIGELYFPPDDGFDPDLRELLTSLPDPIVDVGCGAGQHALWLQERDRTVVGFDASPGAVRAARERGLSHALVMDMFELGFPADALQSALVIGTQLGLAGSLAGVRERLDALARVTEDDGVAVVDSYDPDRFEPGEMFGYRPDPRAGVARRAFHFEYERRVEGGGAAAETERLVGRTLSFVLFSPDRLREVVRDTPWTVDTVQFGDAYYRARLRKE